LPRFFGVLPERFEPPVLHRLMARHTLRRSVETDTKSQGCKGATLHSPRMGERGSLPLTPTLPLPRSNELGATSDARSVCSA
jgi:hypothetical protein